MQQQVPLTSTALPSVFHGTMTFPCTLSKLWELITTSAVQPRGAGTRLFPPSTACCCRPGGSCHLSLRLEAGFRAGEGGGEVGVLERPRLRQPAFKTHGSVQSTCLGPAAAPARSVRARSLWECAPGDPARTPRHLRESCVRRGQPPPVSPRRRVAGEQRDCPVPSRPVASRPVPSRAVPPYSRGSWMPG